METTKCTHTTIMVALAAEAAIKLPLGVTNYQLIESILQGHTKTTGGLNIKMLREVARINGIGVKRSDRRSTIECALRSLLPIRFARDVLSMDFERAVVNGWNYLKIDIENWLPEALKCNYLHKYFRISEMRAIKERCDPTPFVRALKHVFPHVTTNAHVEYILTFADAIDPDATFETLLAAAVERGEERYLSDVFEKHVMFSPRYRTSPDDHINVSINQTDHRVYLLPFESNAPGTQEYAYMILQNEMLWDLIRRAFAMPDVVSFMCDMKRKIASSKTPRDIEVQAVTLLILAYRVNALIHRHQLALPKLVTDVIQATPTDAHSRYYDLRFCKSDQIVLKQVRAQTVYVPKVLKPTHTYLVALAQALKLALIDCVDHRHDKLMLQLTLFPDIAETGNHLRVEINFVRCGYRRGICEVDYNVFARMVMRFMREDVTCFVREFV